MKRLMVWLGVTAVLFCIIGSAQAQEGLDGWETQGAQKQPSIRITGEGQGKDYIEGLNFRYLDLAHGRGILQVNATVARTSMGGDYVLQRVVEVLAEVERVHCIRITDHAASCKYSACTSMVVNITFQPRATLPLGPTLQHGG